MINGIITTVIRTSVGFALLLLIVRLIGNKQLGQLNVFTYISGIAVGSMAGEMVIHSEVALSGAIGSMGLWCALTLLVEYLSMKNARARILLDGQPVIVIKKGRIIYESLKRERLNIDDLTMLLRSNRVFSVTDVEYAILESNGELSVLKKAGGESVTRDDMKIQAPSLQRLPAEIISDGKIIERNLIELNLTKERLSSLLLAQGIKAPREVLYAELQPDGTLYVQKTL